MISITPAGQRRPVLLYRAKLVSIRPLGLRGAYDIREFLEDLGSSDERAKRDAEELLPEIGQRLGLDQSKLWYVIHLIAYDQYTDFMYAVWS